MKQITRRSTLKGVGAGFSLTFAGVATAKAGTRYIVTVSNDRAHDRLENEGFTIENELTEGDVVTVVGREDAVDDIERIKGVTAATQDFELALEEPVEIAQADEDEDPLFWDIQWDKHVTDVERAHETATGAGSTVAIVDTGVDASHPDLQNVDTKSSAAIIDGEVTTGDAGWAHPHGTHVAGIAAAQGKGIVGMAPDAEILNLRVFPEDRRFAFASDILLALVYAAEQGADAANLSLATGALPPQVNAGGVRAARERVVNYVVSQGTLVSAAAANDDANLKQGGYFNLTSSVAGAMSISATAPNDKRSFYSNYGSNAIDVGAPGGGYETLAKTLTADWDGDGDCEYPVGDTDDDDETEYEDRECVEWPFPLNLVLSTVPNEEYLHAAGTSMAAPQVTGAAALIREVAPGANARQVEQAIKHGADSVNGQNDDDLGAGRLNAADSLDAA